MSHDPNAAPTSTSTDVNSAAPTSLVEESAALESAANVDAALRSLSFERLGLEHPAIGQTPFLPPREPLGARIAALMGRHHALLLMLSVLLLWAITSLPPLWQRDAYVRGQLAPSDILAPHGAMLLDRRETDERREEAASLVPPSYDSNTTAQARALTQLRALLFATRQALTQNAIVPIPLSASTSEDLPTAVPDSATGKNLPPAEKLAAQRALALRLRAARAAQKMLEITQQRAAFTRRIEARFGLAITPRVAQTLWEISRSNAGQGGARWVWLEKAAQNGVSAVYVGAQVRSDVADDFKAAQSRIARAVNASTQTLPLSAIETRAAIELARFVAREPNLVVDARDTQKARQAARNEVRQVFVQIAANSPIVRAGEPITDERWVQMQDLNIVSPRFDWRAALAYWALCCILVGVCANFLSRFHPRLVQNPTQLWLAAAIPLLFSLFFRLVLRVPHAEAAAMPLAATAAMLLTVLLDARVGLLTGFSVAAVCAIMARADAGLFLAASLASATGTLGVANLASRGQLVRAGAVLSVVSGILAAMLGAFREAPWEELLSMVTWGAVSGAIATLAMAGLAMFLERPFGITTHLRLLELLSPDEVVMRRMQAEAPGTYTHSMMVGNLSEAAAKAIGSADPLLCRVGGIYHDIGKLRRPHCFIENQSGNNIHDQLSPQLSALVILAHVKDGLELGRALHLPSPVLQIIEQHHGTSLVSYFYERAKREATEGTVVDESAFRYAGPRPQSKEAAIVMLADTIEASSRSLPHLTPETLQAHIATMIEQPLRDGELSSCDLTLRDIQIIEETFAHVLRGVLHHRIEYPDAKSEIARFAKPERMVPTFLSRKAKRRQARQRQELKSEAAPPTLAAIETDAMTSASTCSEQTERAPELSNSQATNGDCPGAIVRPARRSLRLGRSQFGEHRNGEHRNGDRRNGERRNDERPNGNGVGNGQTRHEELDIEPENARTGSDTKG